MHWMKVNMSQQVNMMMQGAGVANVSRDACAEGVSARGGRRLGELLCQRGLLTSEQLAAALHEQETASPRRQLAQILLDRSMVCAEAVAQALAESVGTPFVTLAPGMVHADALAVLPKDFMEKHNLLPLSHVEGWLTVAVEQFTNVFLHEEIAHVSSAKVQVIAAEAQNIRQTRQAVMGGAGEALAQKKVGDDLDSLLGKMSEDELKVVEDAPSFDEADLEATASDSPVVKLVNLILRGAVEAHASDIHIEPQEATFRVRYRVDGELVESIEPPLRMLAPVVSRIKILSGLDISERRLPQDGGMTVTLASRPIDLRVSTMTTKYGEKVVMRIVDREAAIQSLDALGFSPGMLAGFRAAVQSSNGIVLVTGPTGSGKTTTLYSALGEIVSSKRNISTIEDPVERRLTGTNQFQIHAQAGFTFAAALRSLLRQDPDVIMVGEIRDAQTAKLATEAALTGHLVLSTLHTNDSLTAIPRLVNMGVEHYLVAASLRAVLAQRLVRQVCPHCRTPRPLEDATRDVLAKMMSGACPVPMSYFGKGCGRCRNTGVKGRVGVFELLMLNEEMLSVITREDGMKRLRQAAREQGWMTLLHDGLEKVHQGLITVEGLLGIVSHVSE